MPAFQDHFGAVAEQYAASRPTYPEELFDWIASISPGRTRVWDCATGTGQAVRPLAARFDEVIATDASASQVANAPAISNVEWRVASAFESGLDDASVDAVTVAQALHWFYDDRFFAEVRRVLRPGGVLVVWSYASSLIDDVGIRQLLQEFQNTTLNGWWPSERRFVMDHYRDFALPPQAIAAPSFEMAQQWDLQNVAGYLRSWSAVGRYMAETGQDPVAPLLEALEPLWVGVRDVRWPLTVLASRVVAA